MGLWEYKGKGSFYILGYYTLGDFIGEARRQLGITQEELAYGICSPGTISKIENGCAIPKRRNYEAIMQRLGKATDLFQMHITHGDVETYAWMRKITKAVMHQRIEEARQLLDGHKDKTEQTDALYQQFCLYMTAVIHSHQGVNPLIVLKELQQALALTGIDVENYFGQRRMFTSDEIVIINNVAIQYQRNKEYKDAWRIWDRMKEYLERKHIDEEEREKLYPLILFNYGNLLYDMKIYEEAIELCEKGIAYCRLCNRYVMLPYLLYCKAACLQVQGDGQAAEAMMLQAEQLSHVLLQQKNVSQRPVSITC